MQELKDVNHEQHSIQIDGLRFFAVLAVMFCHFLQWDTSFQFVKDFPFNHGVVLFFVLSGFLITRIILKYKANTKKQAGENRQFLKSFYIRRALRIFPIYYLLLFLLLGINFANVRELAPWLFSYTLNFYEIYKGTYLDSFSHLWSLSVEEQFYLFWPMLLLLIPAKRIVLFIISAIAFSILLRTGFFIFTENWLISSLFTLTNMHALGLGALLAWLTLQKHSFLKNINKPIWIYVGVVLYILSVYLLRRNMLWYRVILDDLFFAIVSVLIIYRASYGGFRFAAKWILEHPVVVHGGKISYGMYLYHLFMPQLFYYCSPKIGLGISNKYTFFIALCTLTYVIAHLSWTLIEKPLNRLKIYFPYTSKQ